MAIAFVREHKHSEVVKITLESQDLSFDPKAYSVYPADPFSPYERAIGWAELCGSPLDRFYRYRKGPVSLHIVSGRFVQGNTLKDTDFCGIKFFPLV